ncbi:carbohydrate-binding protein [Coraliomargarita akajimensis]|uniref:CBM6 domain-containing protein n=1 Tax=Coraliomargarita akajimensis (strain DSM 45221 / IAM 15411 / JCM 23193 / KCTC 12865 / 04OKA010-24) TaxID=583355 RepID=D5EI90_CORAD|nr:carbohydrate-binding protein [Coraliomargarita akajimensis]ADE56130.1 protein of unknown function DUF1565 [Coraliomargarita akajimensis DSM 45221]
MKNWILALTSLMTTLSAAEFHVAKHGEDSNPGTAERPFLTISKGASVAMPGDIITVHEGVYREEIDPPRGGTSDSQRIVYRAAEGESVVIKGSEPVDGWEHVEGAVWKLTIDDPDAFFGAFNPFRTQIYGDWYRHEGRLNHVGQVYLNGHWLTEAVSLDAVMQPVGEVPLWYTNDRRYPKDRYGPSVDLLEFESNGQGGTGAVRVVESSERSELLVRDFSGDAYVQGQAGQWLRYDDFDFGTQATKMKLTAMTETFGGLIELRLDGPDGKLLGQCQIDSTGHMWSTGWHHFEFAITRMSGVQTICLVFKDKPKPKANEDAVIIWAQFPGLNPNEAMVEINARETVFYPRQTGINYITVSGFTLEHGSPNWAPPTAEQVGLIGTHWSKGWIIENNTIRYSSCVGITLGKYGDAMDNKAMSAEGYVGTIKRALDQGWSKANIGSHIVRNNRISYCEQAGIVGSMGVAFSEITGNEVFECHRRGLFSGAEMAGIKFHAPIDTLIANNHVYDCYRGMWLDWMTQGTRVSQNLFHGNTSEDLWMEVNHGPCVIDNNFFLSTTSINDWSQGSAFIHNLIAGHIRVSPQGRITPYHPEHSTEIAGLDRGYGGDNRFFNNIFAGADALTSYAAVELPLSTGGNLFLGEAKALDEAKDGVVLQQFDPKIQVVREDDAVFLKLTLPDTKVVKTSLITSETLGETAISKLTYKNYDASALVVSHDYWGRQRDSGMPTVGPVETSETGGTKLKLWPKGETVEPVE